jgi:hypothetical protein
MTKSYYRKDGAASNLRDTRSMFGVVGNSDKPWRTLLSSVMRTLMALTEL